MPLVSAFRCLFKEITTKYTNSLTGRLSFFHSRGILSKLFVGGLSFDTTEKVLRDAFSPYGRILEVSVMVNRNGLSKGWGFVEFASEREADNALGKMDGQYLDGRNIRVEIASLKLHCAEALPKAVGPPPGVEPVKVICEEKYRQHRMKRYRD